MKSSPHRPLILKRRKLSLSPGDTSRTPDREEPSRQGHGSPTQEYTRTNKESALRERPGSQEVPAGVKIMNHPTLPNTQVVAIPAHANIHTILEALTTKGKESGRNGPHKFILISSGSSTGAFKNLLQSKEEHSIAHTTTWEGENLTGQNSGAVEESALETSELQPLGQELEENSSDEITSCGLDNSLTNIQWLGKMSSDGLSPCTVRKETEKENLTPRPLAIKTEEGSAAPSSAPSWPESFSERPPYSYMAMIQFAINSTERKRMMLKDIYAWIEDHFPYFKHVAKPGWKNSIRHNLSLHNMFVRETSANGKISFWTIHPEANRYLTLDQVFKQQKRHIPDLPKNTGCLSGGSQAGPQTQAARRKMKPLLPRVNSYLVPIQFPVSQSLVLQPSSSSVPLPAAQSTTEIMHSIQQVRIAPKVLLSQKEPTPHPPAHPIKEEAYGAEESPLPASHLSAQESAFQSSEDAFPAGVRIKQEHDGCHSSGWASSFIPTLSVKEEPVQPGEEPSSLVFPAPPANPKSPYTALKSPPPPQDPSHTLVFKRQERHEAGRSRRKQHLSRPCAEEPVLVLPPSSGPDPFMLGHCMPFELQVNPLGQVSHLSCSQEESGPFKTPVKEMLCALPTSSTPSKNPSATPPSLAATDPWRVAPFLKEMSGLDLSPTRTPPRPSPLPFQENGDLLGFNSTPPRQPLFDSPRLPLLHAEASALVSGPWTSSPASSHHPSPELQAANLSENHSLLEGLVLDTMNDSLSKIFLDASFPGFEDDNLGTDLSWSQFIPELK